MKKREKGQALVIIPLALLAIGLLVFAVMQLLNPGQWDRSQKLGTDITNSAIQSLGEVKQDGYKAGETVIDNSGNAYCFNHKGEHEFRNWDGTCVTVPDEKAPCTTEEMAAGLEKCALKDGNTSPSARWFWFLRK